MTNASHDIPEEPIGPALLFEQDGHMSVIHDLAVTDELIESPDEVYEAFDGEGRPLQAVGPAGDVSFCLASDQPQESKIRERVQRYYAVFAARHHTRIPPGEQDLATFIFAVANDEVIE